MDIDFIGESYTSRSPAVDCQETINMYPETTERMLLDGYYPIKQGSSKTKIVLMRTPGLKLFCTVGS
jgi:hypothetical protein